MIHRFDFVVVDVDSQKSLLERRVYAAAQQVQLREHIAPAWQGDATMSVRAATPDAPAMPGEVQIRLVKRAPTDPQDALGYHASLPDGTPVIYVFTDLAAFYGDAWTSIASHEVGEVVGDPRLRLCVEMSDGSIWDREMCDRVERDVYYVDAVVDGQTYHVPLSNFNYPECFEPPADLAGVKFDHMGLSTRPNEVRDGGYAQRLGAGGWNSVGKATGYRAHLDELHLSRSRRRRTQRPSWWRRILARVFGTRALAAA